MKWNGIVWKKMKWNGIVEKMKNGNGMEWEKLVSQTRGKFVYKRVLILGI